MILGGELYVLTLLVDAMRSVKGFHVDKAAASVLTTCLSTLGNGYLFLGSRLGNSLLLKYTSREAGQVCIFSYFENIGLLITVRKEKSI